MDRTLVYLDVRIDVLQLYSGNYFKYVQINIYYS